VSPLLLWSQLRGDKTGSTRSSQDVALLRTVPMFAVLSQLVLERVAHVTTELRVSASTVLIRQGESAGGFYVVDEGTFAVTVDGRDVRVLGRGDCFGEIGLLHVRPRTATVVAESDGRLLVIEGPTFLAAVTGHTCAEKATEELVRHRMAQAP
jgi:CRP-like cAMP-binding protein